MPTQPGCRVDALELGNARRVAPSLHDLPESWRERSPDDRELVYAMLAGGGSPRIVVELAAPDERPNLRPGPRLRGFHLRRSEDVVGTS